MILALLEIVRKLPGETCGIDTESPPALLQTWKSYAVRYISFSLRKAGLIGPASVVLAHSKLFLLSMPAH
jgi:hypothetical protein